VLGRSWRTVAEETDIESVLGDTSESRAALGVLEIDDMSRIW
jgi:hypothetical protein